MIYSLQYLRGIAALLVVLYHSRYEINNVYPLHNLGDLLFQQGYIGVDLFFMVSGFVIMLSTENDSSVKSFILKRFFRLYPVYISCLIMTVLLFNKPLDYSFLKAILLINDNISLGAPWFGYALVFTAWTLMFEVIFYAYFCLSLLISKKHRGLICSIIISTIVFSVDYLIGDVVTLSGYYAIPIDENSSNVMYALRVLSSPMFIEFIVGIFIYYIYKNIDLKIIKTSSPAILSTSILIFFFFYISGYNGGHGLSSCGVFAAILLLGLVIYEKYHSIKQITILNKLGDFSYSLYLTHPIIINSLSTGVIVTSAYSNAKGFSNLYLIIISSLFISAMLFFFVEKPFIKISRKIINKNCIV